MDKPNRLRRHFPFFFPFYFSFGFFLFLIVAEDTWTQTPPQKNDFFFLPFFEIFAWTVPGSFPFMKEEEEGKRHQM